MATLPGRGVFSGGCVEGGSDVPPIYFIGVFIVGAVAVAFDAVGRGWIWASSPKPDHARPELSFVLVDKSVKLSDDFAGNGTGRFYLRLSVSKSDGAALKIVRVEIEDAEILEFGVGDGDGVQKSATIDRTGGSEIGVLGSFPKANLSRGSAKRTVTLVDEFDRSWSVGLVTFRLPV